ncbi:MAG: baseplate J/gp47 family protein [Bellilinea sp.]|jgi:hypothetical protein
MKTHIIRLESFDDFISIRDKMSWAKAARILVVFPRRRPPQLERLDLTLLQRRARALGCVLGLVTQDKDTLTFARDLGLATFPTIPAAQRMPWRSAQRRYKFRPGRKNRKPEIDTLRSRASQSQPRSLNTAERIFFFLLGLTGFLALMFFFLPTATVRFEPKRQEQTLAMRVWASPDIPAALPSGAIPAEEIRMVVSGNLEAETTHAVRIGERSATGSVLLTNLTENEVKVPQGSVFRSQDEPPVRFESTQEVIIPAGSGQTIHAPIRALEAGSRANLPTGSIQVIEGGLGLFAAVDNPERTSGGSDRLSRAASEQDYSRMYDTLITSLAEDALQQIENQLKADQVLVAETLSIVRILESMIQPEVGVPADRIRLTLKVEYRAWAYNQADLIRVASDALNASMLPGTRALEETLNIERLDAPQWKPGEPIYFQIRVSRIAQQAYEPAQITAWVRGLPVENARQILTERLDLATPAEIDLHPSWWLRLPYLTFRIAVGQP